MAGPEWIKAYPDELLLSGLSCEAIGFLMKLRALQSKGTCIPCLGPSLGDFDKTSARLLGEDARKCRRLLLEVSEKLTIVNSLIVCTTLAEEMDKYQASRPLRVEAGRLGGLAKARASAKHTVVAEENREEENRKETKEHVNGLSPSKKAPKRSKSQLPLSEEKGEVLEAFREAQATYPIRAFGFNERTRNQEERPVGLGSVSLAERFWKEIIDSGAANHDELYVCAWVARRKWEREQYLWVPNFSTFYGPEKSWWANFIEEARQVIKERNANVPSL